jgi:hypothetical protein
MINFIIGSIVFVGGSAASYQFFGPTLPCALGVIASVLIGSKLAS